MGDIPQPRGYLYQWDVWLDGRPWQMVQGTDFHCLPSSFRMAAYCAARRRGIRLSARVEGPVVILQARPPVSSD